MAELAGLLEPSALSAQVRGWLKEDVPSFDYGGAVVGDGIETAVLYAKSKGILAGKPFFQAVFDELNCEIEWRAGASDGQDLVGPLPIPLAEVKGPVRKILLGERLALNALARCSGIATRSSGLVNIAKQTGWKGIIAGTRKTTPGFRLVEKYGLLAGNADTHRMDLSSMVMLKDNHIVSCGSIRKAVEKAKTVAGFAVKIEVECSSVEDAKEVSFVFHRAEFAPTSFKPDPFPFVHGRQLRQVRTS
uniref:nicotinate-nucleotide diphosphorylase (carboxylating) n=1 Tax=Rhodosorus marinus TaxID=101924 RepID=A0A7S2ZXQ7_9RHOD|mmetsp:Transcript_36997/g.147662  ORF Transcript_36997/g.147662 Transcript_36997/m.147662 type:complete len:247 (+) Transcript_36997:76-816(+)